jgi:hypothetical protein
MKHQVISNSRVFDQYMRLVAAKRVTDARQHDR